MSTSSEHNSRPSDIENGPTTGRSRLVKNYPPTSADLGAYEGGERRHKDSTDEETDLKKVHPYSVESKLHPALNGPAPIFCLVDLETLRSGLAVIETKDKTANPAPLGLLGFGLTTFLLNMHNAGVFELNSMILGMGLLYGGFAQLLAGIFEWKKGNLFAFVAFCSYGCFWISLCALLLLPKMGIATATTPTGMAWYLFIWGCFSTMMFVGTLKKAPWALVFVFFTVVVLFFLLAAHNWTEDKGVGKAAGIEGVICGLSAIYTAFGEVLNEIYGRTIIPLGIRTPTAPKKAQ